MIQPFLKIFSNLPQCNLNIQFFYLLQKSLKIYLYKIFSFDFSNCPSRKFYLANMCDLYVI